MSRGGVARVLDKRLAAYGAAAAAAASAGVAQGEIVHFVPVSPIMINDPDPDPSTFDSVGFNFDGVGGSNFFLRHNFVSGVFSEAAGGFSTSTVGGGTTYVQTMTSLRTARSYNAFFFAPIIFGNDAARTSAGPFNAQIRPIPFGEKVNDDFFFLCQGLCGLSGGGRFARVGTSSTQLLSYGSPAGTFGPYYADYGGIWQGTTGYFGFKFTDEDDFENHFGWMRITVEAADGVGGDDLKITIHEWAYNTEDDGMISAGEVPEPHSLGLLALGAAGVTARRRRKKG